MKYKGFNCINKTQKRWVDSLINHMQVYYNNLETGNTITDKRGKGNNGAVNGTVTNATVNNMNVKRFDGAGNIGLPDNQSLDLSYLQRDYSFSKLVNYHQGIAGDDNYFYLIHTNKIKKYDKDWNLILENTNALNGVGTTHLGDGCVYNGKLYIAAEHYVNSTTYSAQRIAVFELDTLTCLEVHDISAQNFECSGLTIDPTNGIIYVCDCSNSVPTPTIWKYNLSDFSYIGNISVSLALTTIQGLEFYNNKLYLSSNTGIYIMNPSTGVVENRAYGWANGTVGCEGIYVNSKGIVYFLFDTNPDSTSQGTVLRYVHNPSKGAFSHIIWINSDKLPSDLGATALMRFISDDKDFFGIYIRNGTGYLQLAVKTTTKDGTPAEANRPKIMQADNLLKKNTWMMVTCAFDGRIMTLYIDNAKTVPTAKVDLGSNIVLNSGYPTKLGGSDINNPSYMLNGFIGEYIRVDYEVTLDDIKKFYTLTRGKYGV